MGDKITLKIVERDVHGKKVAVLRREGLVPGVVYGPGMDPVSIQADAQEVRKVVSAAGRQTPVHLTGAKRRIAMIKKVDFDPTKHGVVRHVSFHAVKADEPVVTTVPIHLVGSGDSAAEKAGLVVLQTLDRVEVKALPMELPEALEVSVLNLAAEGDRLTVGDITLPEGVTFVEHETGHAEQDDDEAEKPKLTDQMIASVWEPAALQAANEAAAGSAEDESEVESEHGEEEAVNEEAAEGESSDEKASE